MTHQPERAAALAETATQLEMQVALGQQAKILRTRSQQISERADEVEQLLAAASRLDALDAAPEHHDDKAAEVRGFADELLARMEQDPAGILAEKDLRQRFIKPLEEFCQRWRAALLSSWQAWIRTQATFQPEALLSALQNIGSRRPRIERVRDIQGRLRLLSETLPTEEADTQVQALAAELADAQSVIASGDLPEPVEAFLRKLGANEARLSDVDDTVREWLKDEKLLGEFAVVSK